MVVGALFSFGALGDTRGLRGTEGKGFASWGSPDRTLGVTGV